MIMPSNPFTIGQRVTPENFIGRKTLIRRALDQIGIRGSLAVWGGPGMGKSSFLKLLTYPTIWEQCGQDYNQAVVVFIDCQSLEPFKISDFWRNILVTIKNNFSFLKTSIDTLSEKPEATVNDLLIILRLLKEQGKFLVLLIDNYDVTLRPNSQYTKADIDTFVSQCRTLAQSEEQNISIVVTSSRRLSQIGPELTPDKSPWYNGYLFENLKPFTNQEVNLLLDRSESLLGWKQAIRKIADGNPALLQNACFLLYEELVSGNNLNEKKFIQDFQTNTLHLFQAIWQLSTETEQNLLMLLALSQLEGKLGRNRYALGGIEAIFSQKEIELNNLVERGILKKVEGEENTTYSFCSSIMEWWVIKQIENSQEEELKKRQRGFLNLMSRQQTTRVNTAIRWLWQNKDKIASIIEQVGGLLS
jgi:hypothetical protein